MDTDGMSEHPAEFHENSHRLVMNRGMPWNEPRLLNQRTRGIPSRRSVTKSRQSDAAASRFAFGGSALLALLSCGNSDEVEYARNIASHDYR